MRWKLRAASWLVPCHLRAEWLAEWHAEIAYVERHRSAAAETFCRGALVDAWELRRQDADRRMLGLAASAAVAFLLPVALVPVPLLMLAHAAVIALAVLPAVAPIAWDGEFPAANHLRRALFMALKTVLLAWTVYRGALAFGALVTPVLASHLMAAGLAAGLRWAVDDQRHRCPACLRRLEFATSTGNAASSLLDGHSTLLACRAGHGFAHLPQFLTGSFDHDRWFGLGDSPSGQVERSSRTG